MENQDELKYQELFGKWHGWASPVGLGIFFLSLALSVLVLSTAVKKLVEAGEKGVEIRQQLKTE